MMITASPDILTRAVIISLFSWRRADPDDNPDQPAGWWGDSYPAVQNDRTGSRLYLLLRTTLSDRTATLARGYCEEALAWMTEDGVAARVVVDVQRTGTQTLKAGITLYQQTGNRHNLVFDNLWSDIHGRQRIQPPVLTATHQQYPQ